MSATTHERGDDGQVPPQHPDTQIVDELTAFLNRQSEPSGADLTSLLMQLLERSGRPLLALPTLDVDAEVSHDRYGLATATVNIGGLTIKIWQPTDEAADVRIAVTTNYRYGDDYRITASVDGRTLLDPTTLTTDSGGPAQPPTIAVDDRAE